MSKFAKGAMSTIAVALSIAVGGCGGDMTINGEKGVPLSEIDQSGPPPTQLVAAGSDKVIVTQADALTITVEGDDDAVELVRFVRDGDLLGISREGSSWWDSTGSAVIRVGMPAPKQIVLGGSGEVEAQTVSSKAQLTIGGSGSMSIDEVAAERLEITIGGSGSLRAAGTADKLDMTIGGSGSGNLSKLKADDVEISIGGSGSVNVTGSAECELDSFGSGSLNCSPGKSTKPTDK